jgi:predicted RNA binding protein YcfA (HicA-like mRNA interferase family)
VRKLRKLGWAFDRQAAGSHEIWRHAESGRKTTIANLPGDIPEGTLRSILREGQIAVDEFLDA